MAIRINAYFDSIFRDMQLLFADSKESAGHHSPLPRLNYDQYQALHSED